MKKLISLLMALALLMTPVLACAEGYTIGHYGGWTGAVATAGSNGRDAILLAVKQWNEKGGVLGGEIKVELYDDGGTTEGAETGTYDYGTELTVTAVPDEGYKFVYWDGDYPTLRNPLTFTVTSYDWWKPVFTELCKEVFEGENTILASGVVEEDNCYFVPDETAEYRIFSSTEYTKISVLDADKNIIATASGWNWNGFNLNIELTAGETYYFAVGFMGDVTREISLEIRKSLNVTLTAENGTVRGAGSYPYGSYEGDIVCDEHACAEAQPDQDCRQTAGCVNQCGQDGTCPHEQSAFFKTGNSRHQREEHGKRVPVDVVHIVYAWRYEKTAGCSTQAGDAEHILPFKKRNKCVHWL